VSDMRLIDTLSIDGTFKGIPDVPGPFPLGRIGELGWNVLHGDLPLPVALLKKTALHNNGEWMKHFVQATGVQLAPHGKTTMSPQLFRRQLGDGAWGITLATVCQIQVARRFGVSRILMANELVGRAETAYILQELARDPDFDFYCLVDSAAGVAQLAEAARRSAPGRPVQVLLELGMTGRRAGCRSQDEAMLVARAVVAASPWLALRGVEGFEGIVAGTDRDDAENRACAFLDSMVETAARCCAEGLFAAGPVILSAGGSAYFDLVVERFRAAAIGRETMIVLRSGCYLAQDSVLYERAFRRILERSGAARAVGGGLRNALELWSYVLSRPEAARAILGFGKRDVSYDDSMPKPLAWFRPGVHACPETFAATPVVVALNDQHALLDLPPELPLAVGDMVAVGISHPCTTFDKWQLLPVVDDDYTVVEAVRTFF
jgi:D-serine dehydratase